MALLNKVIEPTNPSVLDRFVIGANAKLSTKLTWFDNLYGLSEKKVELVDGNQLKFPAIYKGEGLDYISLFPNDQLGNFGFWDVDFVHLQDTRTMTYKCRISFTVWFNYEKIYDTDASDRRLYNVVDEVAKVFQAIPEITIDIVETVPEKIYKGYTSNDIKNHSGYKTLEAADQYNMRPYGGFKLICDGLISKQC